jgi:hypothetical protein
MNRTQAFRLAIIALEFKRARYRVDANLAEQYGADYPHAIASQKLALSEVEGLALSEVEGMVDQINPDVLIDVIAILQKELEAHNHYTRQIIQ